VSKSVAQLERELGVDLLERTSRDVRLTEAGRALLADGESILAAADAAFARARDHGRGLAGRVAIGVTPAVGQGVVDGAARRLREGAPGLSVAFRELRPDEIASSLRGRRADVVLARTAPRGPGVDVLALAPTPAAVAVPAGHRLAAAAAVRLADLDGERLLTWSPPGTPYTDLLVGLCDQAGAKVTCVESAVTGASGLLELVALDAVALVPVGWQAAPDARIVELEDDARLPLLAIRLVGAPLPAVARLLALLAG
jgi:DNA-binding transcriptional LysR family regulator